MRLLAAALLAWLVAGCAASPPPPLTSPPTQVARATPAGPTPSLPVARAVASPSVSPSAANSGPALLQTFALQSSAFADGSQLPSDFTCDGAGGSPPLTWSGQPPGAVAYALIVQDQDAHVDGGASFVHWLLYNIPRTVNQLAASVPTRPLLTNGAQQGLNSKQSIGYASPCPNHGDGPHHYAFQLFAQDGYVTLETGATFDDVQSALNGHTLTEAQLTVTVQR